MKDEKAPPSARLSAAETLLSRGWGRPILPTVQANTGKTFEQWLDELSDDGKRLLDEGLPRLEQEGDLADWEATGSA
jgi:hypothetical protein